MVAPQCQNAVIKERYLFINLTCFLFSLMLAYRMASNRAAALRVRSVLLMLSDCRLSITSRLNFSSFRKEKLVIKALRLADFCARHHVDGAEVLDV